MANREELGIIRLARSGKVEAQLQLGKLYLFGGAGLPRSTTTAVHWLDRAAQQGCTEAWMAIGAHVPYDIAASQGERLTVWYERAWQSGLPRAGIVFARLVLQGGQADRERHARALCALEEASQAGFPEAQTLLMQWGGSGWRASAAPACQPGPEWLVRAASGGAHEARYALAHQAFEDGNGTGFVEQALPLARELAAGAQAGGTVLAQPSTAGVQLLSRLARELETNNVAHDVSQEEIHSFYELAANENDRHAQLAIGLWCARMRLNGERTPGEGAANFKRAIRWLTLAAEQGLASAWYALSRIYIKSEFSQRSLAEAHRFLERAAEMGYRDAQLELGLAAWRIRREQPDSDVRALYWMQKAAAQGCSAAHAMLGKIAPAPQAPEDLPEPASCAAIAGRQPLLAARLALAHAFGLSRAEALLLDVNDANHGHCLLVDIRGSYGRGKRRLVRVETEAQRAALARAQLLFERIDTGSTGPEGNYRQRLYRLKTCLASVRSVKERGARPALGTQMGEQLAA